MVERFLSPTIWHGISQCPIFLVFLVIVFVALLTIGLASSLKWETTYFANVQCARYCMEDLLAPVLSIIYYDRDIYHVLWYQEVTLIYLRFT